MFNLEILWKFHHRKRDKSYTKDPYFFSQTFHNGIELCQDQYLSMNRL